MASVIIHICVAKKVNEYLKMREKELFLGAIAPDISKQIHQSKEKSHFITDKEDIPNIELFLSKYKDKIKSPFDYGYLIHLYTDKIWYENIEGEVISKSGEELLNDEQIKNDSDKLRDLFYGDYTNMNIKLIDKYHLDLTLFYEEFEVPKTCIKDIPIKKLNILIDNMGVIIANSHNRRNKIFDYTKVVSFINEMAEETISFLKENGL